MELSLKQMKLGSKKSRIVENFGFNSVFLHKLFETYKIAPISRPIEKFLSHLPIKRRNVHKIFKTC